MGRVLICLIDAIWGMFVTLGTLAVGLLVFSPTPACSGSPPGWIDATLLFAGLLSGPFFVSFARRRVLDEAIDGWREWGKGD